MRGWVASGNWELFREQSVKIWKGHNEISSDGSLIRVLGDIDYVKISDFITMIYNRGDFGCGTFAECGIAVEYDKPIYLITDMIKKELPMSLLQFIEITQGDIFNSPYKFFEFIDNKFKLKRSKNG